MERGSWRFIVEPKGSPFFSHVLLLLPRRAPKVAQERARHAEELAAVVKDTAAWAESRATEAAAAAEAEADRW